MSQIAARSIARRAASSARARRGAGVGRRSCTTGFQFRRILRIMRAARLFSRVRNLSQRSSLIN
jgi:hypothetical protein